MSLAEASFLSSVGLPTKKMKHFFKIIYQPLRILSLHRSRTVTAPDTRTQKSNPNSRLSFHEFKKIKEDERVKKIKAKKRKPVEEVKIQIGGMEEAAGRLKKVKGRTLPLMVPTDITAGELLKAATANMEGKRRHSQQKTKSSTRNQPSSH